MKYQSYLGSTNGVCRGGSIFKRTVMFQALEVDFLLVIEFNGVLVLVLVGEEGVVGLAILEVFLFEAQAGDDVVLEDDSKGNNIIE